MKQNVLRVGLTLIIQLFLIMALNAQTSGDVVEISGTITDANGVPLPGVSIYVKGTQSGTSTDFDGNYAYSVPKGSTVVFSYVGYTTVERVINESGIVSFSMSEDVGELNEVVITALGIKKERKAIGYSVDQLSAEELNSVGEPNVLLNLASKAPGVQVNGSPNGIDGTPRVVIRGVTSLSNDNQPLYVLDGLPLLSNRSLSEGIFPQNNTGQDFGNPLSDINPNDIESISILKGASATALYGARGANGVIMITTKKGKAGQKGLGVTVSSTTTFQNPIILPEPQLQYGQGFNGEYEYVDGAGGGTRETELRLWGPEYNGRPISQWDPTTGGAVVKPWLPYGKDNIRNFFETGHTLQNNISLTHVTQTSNARLSLGQQEVKGITPNTGLKRITGSFNSTFNLGDKLTLSFVGTGSKMTSNNRAGFAFGGGSPFWSALFVPTNIDIRDLRNYKDEFGNKVSFYRGGPNPYWDLNENITPSERNRFSYNIGLTYQLTDWLTWQGNLYSDTNTNEYQRIVAKHLFSNGSYAEGLNLNKEVNLETKLFFNKEVYKNLDLSVMAGAATRHEKSQSKYASTDGGLSLREIYNLGNSVNPPLVNNARTEKKVNSVFGSVELNYNDYAFLTVTGRNDWSSTLPKDAWSFFYPSFSGSFVFTDAFNIKNDLFTFGKLRASWAEVGNDTQPYALNRYVTRNTASYNGQPVLGLNNVIPSPTVVPEKSVWSEIGGELYFLDSRIRLDVSVYKSESSNQLAEVENAWERGARYTFINSGTITNKGVEVKLDLNPIKTDNFRWDVSMNWARNRGTVSGFPEDITNFKYIGAFFGPETRATNGQPYGHFVGFEYFRDTQDSYDNVPNHANDFAAYGYTPQNNIYGTGQILTRNGFPMQNQWRGTRNLGVVAPVDWSGGIRNTLNYKNFQLNFLFDIRYGGNLISATEIYYDQRGYLPYSAGVNSIGGDVRGDVSSGGGIIFDGIDVETGQPNTIAVDAQDLIAAWNKPTTAFLRDATNIKLRELSLSYNFSKDLVSKFGLESARLSLIGRNLWLIKNELDHVGIDSEVASMGALNNGLGFETGSLPNTRSLGVDLSISF